MDPPTPPQPQRSEAGLAEARVAGLEGLVGSLSRLLGDTRQELALAGLTPTSRAGQRKAMRNKSSPRSSSPSSSSSSSTSSKPVDIGEDNNTNNEEHKQAGEKMKEKAKEKTSSSSSSSSSAVNRTNNKRAEPARRKEEEIESAVRAWADSAAAPSASMTPTAGGSPVLSPRGGRRRKEQQAAAAQQLPLKAERLVDVGRIRNRANAVAVPEGTTMPPLPPHTDQQECKESNRAITASASNSSSHGKPTIVEVLRRREEERARQMEAFFAAMERTYIDERERRERDLEELKLADLEREFADMRARLREAIGCNARHAGELAERERRIGKLQAQIRLTKRRVAALERDARETVARQQRSSSAASSDTSAGTAQQQWSIGRARQRRTRSIDATRTWRPPVWKSGSGGVHNKTGSLDDVTDDGDEDDDDDDYDDDEEEEDGDESDDVVLSMNRSDDLHASSSSSAATTYTGVFFPSRRERTGSTVLSSQVSGDRFMASAARQTSLVMPFPAPGTARLALSRETSPRPSVDSDLSDLERRRSHSFGHGTDGGQHSAPVTPSSPFPPELPRSRPQVRIKEKNSKAFAVLGVDPTQAKLMSVLGIDMPMMEDAKKVKKIKDDDAYIAPSWDLRGSVSAQQQKKNRLISRVSHKVRGVRD